MQMVNDEIDLLRQLQRREIKAFKILTIAYAWEAQALALSLIDNVELAIEVVNQLLYRLLNNPGLLYRYMPRRTLQESINIMVIEECLGALKVGYPFDYAAHK